MTPSADLIAERHLTLVHPDGRQELGRLWVARPTVIDDRESRCAVGIDSSSIGTLARWFAIDCALGKRSVLEQIGQHLKSHEQFGYQLEDSGGNLNAVRDGFEFTILESGRFVLELPDPEALWREDEGWFDGLLAIASEHSRCQLALGRRFFTVLFVDESSPLIGRAVDKVSIPYPRTPPKRPHQGGQ